MVPHGAAPMQRWLDIAVEFPWHFWLIILFTSSLTLVAAIYSAVFIVAPDPRPPRPYEYTYRAIDEAGQLTEPQRLPCWHDKYLARKSLKDRKQPDKDVQDVEAAEIFMSVVVPAFNEEDRLRAMLEEAAAFLSSEYGQSRPNAAVGKDTELDAKPTRKRKHQANGSVHTSSNALAGWEILVVSDGSTDSTVDVALDFAKAYPGGAIRVITLLQNRGKGGAVTHGLRHVRGAYAVFADADGASTFSDLSRLVSSCEDSRDGFGRAVGIGSRAHLVGSDAVVKRSWLRNFLMHAFHLLLRLLTPPATSRVKDTQCGFKLFSRSALPYIVPHMHSEGWIFDVEMLMLAEDAGIPMVEVPIGWKEVKGSKLNVIWDSLGMAWGLAILRLAWGIGVYRV